MFCFILTFGRHTVGAPWGALKHAKQTCITKINVKDNLYKLSNTLGKLSKTDSNKYIHDLCVVIYSRYELYTCNTLITITIEC